MEPRNACWTENLVVREPSERLRERNQPCLLRLAWSAVLAKARAECAGRMRAIGQTAGKGRHAESGFRFKECFENIPVILCTEAYTGPD